MKRLRHNTPSSPTRERRLMMLLTLAMLILAGLGMLLTANIVLLLIRPHGTIFPESLISYLNADYRAWDRASAPLLPPINPAVAAANARDRANETATVVRSSTTDVGSELIAPVAALAGNGIPILTQQPTSSPTATPQQVAVITTQVPQNPTATAIVPTSTQPNIQLATNTPTPTVLFTPTSAILPLATSISLPTSTRAVVLPNATNTATRTTLPTSTTTRTASPTSTAFPTSTSTNIPTATSTNSPTSTPTNTVLASNTPTETATSTPTETATNTPTATFLTGATNTRVPTSTPTATATSTIIGTATNTPTVTDTTIPTNTSTTTATSLLTDTPTATSTATATPTDTATPSNTATDTPTATATATPDPCTFVVTNPNDAGIGSLRQAILNANTCPGTDTITFNIPSSILQAITPASALPAISEAAIIDASTQPGFAGTPIIELSGSTAGANVDGLTFSDGSDGSIIRGLVINRFNGNGISVLAANTTIIGNYIGTDITGATIAGNTGNGINLNDTSSVVIGGVTPAERNVISGNGLDGILSAGKSTIIYGNYIGIADDGSVALANGSNGIELKGSSGTSIGSAVSGAGNVISGNMREQIFLNNTNNTTIQGNWIGTNATGTAAPTGIVSIEDGIRIDFGSNNNLIGGMATNTANIIAYNNLVGIYVGAGIHNTILGNAIYANADGGYSGLGIDLGIPGVNSNDGAKNPTQSNELMDYPIITTATSTGTNLSITGYIGTAPGDTDFADARVEFFASDNDLTGYGEGQTYLGALQTDANGNFSGSFAIAGFSGNQITATATDTTGNTSEFGPNVSIGSPTTSLCSVKASNALSGTLYDSGGEFANYGDNESCGFHIDPTGTPTIIRLSFTQFNLENGYDFLRVYDGASASGILLGEFTGNTLPGDLYATSGAMFIMFISDAGVTQPGFTANWSTNNGTGEYYIGTAATSSTLSNGTLYDSGGPSSNYRDNESGTFLISPLSGGIITLQFSEFHTEAGYDKLRIYDGVDATGMLLGEFSGPGLPAGIFATSGNMYLEWQSDTGITRSGFIATWTITAQANNYYICTTTNVSSLASGTLYDQSGPGANYRRNQSCGFLISPSGSPTSITLSFSEFDTETSYDILRVYDGADTNGILLGTFSGSSIPPNLVATSGNVYLEWISDAAIVRPGFSINWTSL